LHAHHLLISPHSFIPHLQRQLKNVDKIFARVFGKKQSNRPAKKGGKRR